MKNYLNILIRRSMYVKIKKKRMKNLEKLYKYFFFIALTMIRIKKNTTLFG